MGRPRQASSAKSNSPTAATGKVGNYAAPVDTAGMSQADKETFGLGSPSLVRKSTPDPVSSAVSSAAAVVKRVVSGVGRHLNSTGSQRSPSTMLDRKPKAPADTLSDAERERIARKYVD